MKLRISFNKIVIEFVQDGLSQFAVFGCSTHIVLIADLENHFIKQFFLFAITDFFVVIFDATIFAFLLCIKLGKGFIEQIVVRLLNGCVAIFNVQMCSGLVNIFCEIGTAIMSNDTVTRHSTNGSSYSGHLQNCGIL